MFGLVSVWLYSNAQQTTGYEYTARKTTTPIRTNGRMDEAVWDSVPFFTGFTQSFPTDTLQARDQTQVKIIYDHKNIYVGIRCLDSMRGRFIIQSLKRDFSITRTDAVVVSFSPQNDNINGFSFGVNPYGVQREGLIATGGVFGVTTAWDNAWFAETQRNQGYWETEMMIPLKTLRYKSGSQVWGLNVARYNFKRNENSNWSRVPRGFNSAHLGFAGTLKFEEPLQRAGFNLAIIPYVLGGINYHYDKPKKADMRNLANAGFDLKYGVSSSLNLDVTFNTDFAQVEVDDQIINLDRFEIFLPEKRQFFIENNDLFEQFGFTRIRPFFSRRIGLFRGKNIPVIGGARLSGSINKDWRIGAMNMQTLSDAETGLPAENFSVAAFQRRVFDRSNIAFIAVNKYRFNKNETALNNNSTVLGVDYNLYSKNNFWRGKFFYHHSFNGAVKPLANAHAVWLMYKTPQWEIHWNHEYVGKDYQPEVGFLPRKDYVRFEPIMYRTFFANSGPVFSHVLRLYNSGYFNQSRGFESTDQIIRLGYDLNFKSSAYVSFNLNQLQTRLYQPFNLNGVLEVPFAPGSYWYTAADMSFTTDFRKPLFGQIRLGGGQFFDALRSGVSGFITARIQPYALLTFNFERNDFFTDNTKRVQSITLLTSKIELAFTRDIFFNSFIQYNTQARSFGTNIRLQWRFKPMSDLFLVYTDNYTEQFVTRSRAWVIKLNYWFSI